MELLWKDPSVIRMIHTIYRKSCMIKKQKKKKPNLFQVKRKEMKFFHHFRVGCFRTKCFNKE